MWTILWSAFFRDPAPFRRLNDTHVVSTLVDKSVDMCFAGRVDKVYCYKKFPASARAPSGCLGWRRRISGQHRRLEGTLVDALHAQEIWSAAVEACRADGSLSDFTKVFADSARPVIFVDDIFIVAVTSDFMKQGLEMHVREVVQAKISELQGSTVSIKISVDPSSSSDAPMGKASADLGFSQPAPAQPAPAQPAPAQPAPVQPAPVQTAQPAPAAPATLASPSEAQAPETGESPDWAPSAQAPSAQPSFPERNDVVLPASTPQADTRDSAGYFDDPAVARKAAAAGLNANYTFDTFVVGESNRMAHAFAQNVAEVPGGVYNPLFLYSDSGLGKTHLMHAIGNYAVKMYPERNIRYVSAEEFTNAFINAVRDGTESRALGSFKDEFRNVDVLLIDDIQFIGGKESTVEEFFWTFEALIKANKQIVITSDVHPNLLNGFETRLISRFNQGITTDITAPVLETRIAIIEKKAAADGIDISRDVSEYLAESIRTNVREMEGALHRVTAFAGLNGQPIDIALAQTVLRDIVAADSIEITASTIMGKCAEFFNYTLEDFRSSSRVRELAYARQIAMYLCREMTELSLPKIGELFGGRDHTTVLHACKKINKEMSEKPETYRQIQELTSRIKQVSKAR